MSNHGICATLQMTLKLPMCYCVINSQAYKIKISLQLYSCKYFCHVVYYILYMYIPVVMATVWCGMAASVGQEMIPFGAVTCLNWSYHLIGPHNTQRVLYPDCIRKVRGIIMLSGRENQKWKLFLIFVCTHVLFSSFCFSVSLIYFI